MEYDSDSRAKEAKLAKLYDKHDGVVSHVAREIDLSASQTHVHLVDLGIHEPETRLHDVLVSEDMGPEDLGLEGDHVA